MDLGYTAAIPTSQEADRGLHVQDQLGIKGAFKASSDNLS